MKLLLTSVHSFHIANNDTTEYYQYVFLLKLSPPRVTTTAVAFHLSLLNYKA